MKSKRLFFIPVLVVVLFLFGCTQNETTPSDNTSGVVASTAGNEVVVPADNTASIAGNEVVVPPAPTFELKNWDVNIITDEDGTNRILALEFDYSTTIKDEFCVALVSPNGKLNTDFIEPTGSAWMEMYYQLPGDYQLIVYNPEGPGSMCEPVLWDKNFTFVGPKVSITNAYIEGWESIHVLGYDPTALVIEVKNTGDLPLKSNYSVVVDGDQANPSSPWSLGESSYVNEEDAGYWSYGWIRPGQWTFNVPFGWSLSRGTHAVEIQVFDAQKVGKVIQIYPLTVQTP